MVFTVSVATGEILDYEGKSLLRKQCALKDHSEKHSPEYLAWKESRQRHCQVNHVSSLEEMESLGPKDIFSSSIEKSLREMGTFCCLKNMPGILWYATVWCPLQQ